MDNDLQENSVDLKQRQALIEQFPCFSVLSPIQLEAFARLFHEVIYRPNEKIVIEHELVDSIYIIVSGDAEVTKTIQKLKKIRQVPVASLHAGEGIGLNDTGFYSDTGKRKATVSAMTEMLLLKLDVKDLYEFLKKNKLEVAMHTASLDMMHMRFIKQSLPFTHITHERLQWLAHCVEEVDVPAGTIIFNQGDKGDKCYLVCSGQVEIFCRDDSGLDKQLAILNASVLFGEATLITNSLRNASARALTETKLLELSYTNLTELIESERNVANMFMTLTVDRSRPIQNENVSLHNRTDATGQVLSILKNPSNRSYFKLSEEGVFIWQKCDGKHTLQDITMDLADQRNLFAPDVVAALIFKLNKSGFISNLTSDNDLLLSSQPFWMRAVINLRRIFEARFAIGDADKWITNIYQRYDSYLFTKPVQMLFAVIAIWGFVSFVFETENVLQFFSVRHANLLLLLSLIPFSLIAVFLHELGHAFAVKAFGREVHYIGVGWSWFGPIAFTDTSDIWLASRKQRMLVNFAGIYVDILLAGISSLSIVLISNPYVQATLWLFALYTYLGGFRKLSPLQDSDGYYLLLDWLEKARLRWYAVVWLTKKFPKSIRHPSLFRENKAELMYWVTCVLYLIATTALTFLVQTFVLSVAQIHLSNRYFSLILPFVVLVISCLTIVAEVRNQSE